MIAWEAVLDSEEEQYVAWGHHEKNPDTVAALADAMLYQWGEDVEEECRQAAEDALFVHGYLGLTERFHDYIVCDENGHWYGVDDGEEPAKDVKPATWALVEG